METRQTEGIIMAKTETKILERTYTVPLRREYLKAPNWNRTKKAVLALRQFLMKHMKSEDVRLSTTLNNELWKHGIKNPPHHVKINVMKDDKGVVKAELFGVKAEEPKKAPAKKERKTEAKEHHEHSPETVPKTEKITKEKKEVKPVS